MRFAASRTATGEIAAPGSGSFIRSRVVGVGIGATQIIIAHNHPAGDPEPSADDLAMTKRLATVGKTVGIEVIDHIIVAGEEFVSFKERGLV